MRRFLEVLQIPKDTRPVRHFRLGTWRLWRGALLLAASIGGFLWLAHEWRGLERIWDDPATAIQMDENARMAKTLGTVKRDTKGVGDSILEARQTQARVTALADMALPQAQAGTISLPAIGAATSGEAVLNQARNLRDASRRNLALISPDSALGRALPLAPPFDSPHSISLPFGPRFDPFTGRHLPHEGCDFPGEIGEIVRAPADGVVESVVQDPGYGLTVLLRHSPELTTTYAHLAKALVGPGGRVGRGDPLALLGNSGRSSGPHLHYEIRRNGSPIDPEAVMLQRRIAP